MRIVLYWLVLLVCFQTAGWGQRDPSVFEGLPWEEVERERDAIENAILARDTVGSLVQSGSSMYMCRDTPAFQDITTSVYRAYAGLPQHEARCERGFHYSPNRIAPRT